MDASDPGLHVEWEHPTNIPWDETLPAYDRIAVIWQPEMGEVSLCTNTLHDHVWADFDELRAEIGRTYAIAPDQRLGASQWDTIHLVALAGSTVAGAAGKAIAEELVERVRAWLKARHQAKGEEWREPAGYL